MALINCPECGKQVSNMCQSCPNCGYPILAALKQAEKNASGNVVIEICEGLIGKVKIENTNSYKILWSGRAGQTAEFSINGETPICIYWGIAGPSQGIKAVVKAWEHYELVWQKELFQKRIVLNKLGNIK